MKIEKEYLSLKNIANKYDVCMSTIKKKNLIEGYHFIRIGKLYRYHVKNIDKFFNKNVPVNKFNFDRFYID